MKRHPKIKETAREILAERTWDDFNAWAQREAAKELIEECDAANSEIAELRTRYAALEKAARAVVKKNEWKEFTGALEMIALQDALREIEK